MKKISLIVLILIYSLVFAYAKPIEVRSPDGKNKAVIETDGKVSYSFFRKGTQILANSLLSLTVGDHVWGEDKKCGKIERKSVSGSVSFIVPRKYKETLNRYNQLILNYKWYEIEFRVYNDGVAYRFISTTENTNPVKGEQVQYSFTQDHLSYTLLTDRLQNWFEQDYTVKNINVLPRDSFSVAPVMVQVDKFKVLLAEADLYNYAGMYLRAGDKSFNGVFAYYPDKEEPADGDNKMYAATRKDYIVPQCGKRSFPWRVTGIFDNDHDILNSELIYLLSEDVPKGSEYSWIKPGKVLWDWWNDRNIYNVDFKSGINTATYLYLIDYAAKHHIEYILIDEGWSARNELLTLNPDVDIPQICKYAETKGVGVQLWAKWVNVDRQLDAAFDQFVKWGVKGVKIDFMDRNDAKMVNFYEKVAIKGAENKLLIDFHGSYPNEGMRRKYPNLMTREGVVGLEYNKWSKRATAKHDLIIPYLRMWVGPMDYTPGAMLNAHAETFYENQHEPMSQGTRSHQLAMYVVYESPLQMVSDSPTKYEENKESFEFISNTPTIWDETIPLAGEIGEFIIVARRSGDIWYIGAMNGDTPRSVEVDLFFLGQGVKKIKAHTDGVNASQQAKDFRVVESAITNHKLKIDMVRGGGYIGIIK
jgi:alpha-glucosidase